MAETEIGIENQSVKTKTRRRGRPSRQEIENGGAGMEAGVDRRQLILETSASLFVEKGFEGTSIRDIAGAAGILSGSLYYHFRSKEEIFVEVHKEGMRILTEAVRSAIDGIADPWDRLEKLAEAHTGVLLERSGFMLMVYPRFPDGAKSYAQCMIDQRDAYEAIVSGVIAELGLPPTIDPDIFKLQFLGALNWAQVWYRPGGSMNPKEIGRHLAATLRPD